MPSEDPIKPEANRWLYRDAKGKLHVIAQEGPPAAARQTVQSARVQALAAKLGSDPEALAERIPEDTLRRLKFPVIEQVQPDGTSQFIHDIGIVEGVRPLLATDRAHAGIEPGSAPRPRASDGTFSK